VKNKNIMKKLTLIACLAFATTINAQNEPSEAPTSKGNWIIGGATNIGFSSQKITTKSGDYSVDGQKSTNFNINPTVGYFVIDNLAVGLNLGYEVEKYDEYRSIDQRFKVTNTTFTAMPSLTYFFDADSKAFPYISAGAGYAVTNAKTDTYEPYKINYFVWGAKAGLAYFITPSIGIDLGLSYQQLSTTFNETNGSPENKVIFKNLGASIGFNFVL